jgi:replicative DNA helicase
MATNLDYGHVPPQAVDLEKAVLGAIMLEREALDEVAGILQADSFYSDAHQHIYRSFQNLSVKSQPIDILTVIEQLKSDGKLDAIGGAYYVTTLTNAVVGSANIKAHAMIVQDKYLLREQIRLYSQSLTNCYQDNADSFETLEAVSSAVTKLAMKGVKGEVKKIDTLVVERLKRLEQLRHREEGFTGVPSGFFDIDIITGGWQETDLIILAARPSVGKTALALNFARNAAAHPDKPTPTLFFSLEMSSGQLTDRLLSAESGVDLDIITKAKPDDMVMEKIFQHGVQRMAKYPLFIDDTPALTILDVRAKARKFKNSEDIGLIIIDYLQLMSGLQEDRRQYNREQEVSNISRSLKALAKELKVPIIALSQLNREAETREPTLSNLRESGAIEQDADLVAFLYREDYQKMEAEVDPMLKNVAFIKIAKHRNGALEKIPMNTVLNIQRWMTPAQYQDHLTGRNLGNFRPVKELEQPDFF